ncbi:unnamed protein product, partial [Polarella glacialis]
MRVVSAPNPQVQGWPVPAVHVMSQATSVAPLASPLAPFAPPPHFQAAAPCRIQHMQQVQVTYK